MRATTIILAAALAAAPPSAAIAASLAVAVKAAGKPLADAVVALESADGKAIPPRSGVTLTGIMDQRNKAFVPHILAVEVGTAVQFPNSDNIRHDVYSFSPAKTFELPLYARKPAKPVLFDKPGIVVLGCNIHDWMLAFVDVVPTPYFTQTNAAGAATIDNVPPGSYTLTVWAPRIEAPGHTVKTPVTLDAGNRLTQSFNVTLGPMPAHIHRPTPPSSVVQQLQRKFGRFRTGPPS